MISNLKNCTWITLKIKHVHQIFNLGGELFQQKKIEITKKWVVACIEMYFLEHWRTWLLLIWIELPKIFSLFPFEFFFFLNYLIPWFSSCTPSTVKCMLFIHLSSAYYYTSSDCMCILHFILHCLHIIICFVILRVHILLHFTYRIN